MTNTEHRTTRTALIPIKSFDGMTRLAGSIPDERRRHLSISLADLAASAVRASGLSPLILTANRDVEQWADGADLRTARDEGGGLSAAITAAVGEHAQPDWLVMHADIPLVTGPSVAAVARSADVAGAAISPSVDGGTNVIAGTGAFLFAFGPGSFHTHLARVPGARVVADPALMIEIDTEIHLRALSTTVLPPSLVL